MRKYLFSLVGALVGLMALIATVAVPDANAITNNYEPDHEHDFVGLITLFDESGEYLWRCSGSLIDQWTFLTAGHCTDAPAASAVIYFSQEAGANFDPALGFDPVSGYPFACLIDECASASFIANYGFDNFAGFPDTRDAGLAVLDAPYTPPSGEFGELAPAGTLDALANVKRGRLDTTVLASGYGLSYSSPVGFESYRSRLMGYGELVNLNSSLNGGFNLQTMGNGQGRGGTCSGDSGGPVFYPADSNQIVAVTSFGLNAYCRGVDFSYRVDRTEVQDWIADTLAGFAP